MFKSALKRILLRNSIIASKHANCVTFEETSCRPIFSLKWAKNRTPLRNAETLDNVDDGNDTDVKLLEELPRFWSLCPYKNSIIAYIGGYIIRSIRKTLSCLTCYHATVTNEKNASIDHNLIILKDRGGLFYPSEDVLRILKTSESVFKTVISSNDDMPEIKVKKHLGIRLRNLVLRSLPDVFFNLPCDIENEVVAEELHSIQLTKEIIDKYMRIRLLRHGQFFTEMTILKSKCGLRQKTE